MSTTKSKKTSDVYTFHTNGRITVERNVPKPNLNKLQSIVGGLIEPVHYAENLAARRGIDIYANEEGIILDMEENYSVYRTLGINIAGPVAIVDNRTDRSKSPFALPVKIEG